MISIYWKTGVVVGALTFLGLTVSYNIAILQSIFSSSIHLSNKVHLAYTVLVGHVTEFSQETIFAILVSILFGIHMSIVRAYVQLYRATAVSFVTSLGSGSILSAFIGVGCISCGSLISAFLATLFGASGVVILPLNGREFSILSIALLLLSIVFMVRKIKNAS